jgi:hypothetical protein
LSQLAGARRSRGENTAKAERHARYPGFTADRSLNGCGNGRERTTRVTATASRPFEAGA